MPGITPLLTGRTLDKNKMTQQKMDMFTKNKLKSIVEEEDGKRSKKNPKILEAKNDKKKDEAKKGVSTMNALKKFL